MIDFVLRAMSMYIVALIVIRLMGKRALGELGLFDFVVMTGVGHILTSVALDQSLPFYEGAGVLLTLAMMEYLTGYLSLKNQKLAHLISGRPVVMIKNGAIIRENLGKEKFNVDDLMQELRKQGVRDVGEVEVGILEPSGGFSVILKGCAEPVTRGELGFDWGPETNSILTYHDLSRKEIFDSPQYPEQLEDGISLPDYLSELRDKLDQVLVKLAELEKRV
ncbi:MAG: DUF421 domain-containing protein [Ignavibacteriales bacterium]